MAAAGEDAELLQLWEEWKAQWQRWTAALKFESDTEEKIASESWQPRWSFDSICGGPEGSLQAHFTAFDCGKPVDRFETIKAKNVSKARKKAAELEAQWSKT